MVALKTGNPEVTDSNVRIADNTDITQHKSVVGTDSVGSRLVISWSADIVLRSCGFR